MQPIPEASNSEHLLLAIQKIDVSRLAKLASGDWAPDDGVQEFSRFIGAASSNRLTCLPILRARTHNDIDGLGHRPH